MAAKAEKLQNEVGELLRLQRGSTSTFRVGNQDAWYVVREAWQGKKLLSTSIWSGPFATESVAYDALEHAEVVNI